MSMVYSANIQVHKVFQALISQPQPMLYFLSFFRGAQYKFSLLLTTAAHE